MKFSYLILQFLIATLSADIQERRNGKGKSEIRPAGQESVCKNDSQCKCTASTKHSTYMTSLCFTCSGCSRIPDWLPRNTTELNMSGNCLENVIDASFRHLSNLVSLDLSHCKIRMIQAGAFDGLTHLRVLNISKNPNIEKLSAELFSRLSNLSILVLRNIQNVCKIDGRFLLNLTGLSVFSYGKNHLINFPTFLSRQNNPLLPNLAKLNLEFNSIQALKKEHLRGLENLRILILNKNQISYIESGTFLNLTALFRLELNYNPLTKLEPDSFSSLSLEILSLAKSEYRPKDNIKLLWGLPNLKELNVSRSIGIFSAIAPLKNQTSLEVLSARQDDLFDEDVSNMLTNVPHLRYLDLTDNNINVLENIPFHKLKSLEVLLLGRNWLITVNATSLTKVTWAHLNRVDFSANPLICDCGIVWFRRWLNTTQVIVDRREYIRCSAPEEVKNRILSEIPHPTDMECFQQKSDESLVVGLIAILVLLVYLLSLIVSVFYRFRWHLNYWYFRHKTQANEFQNWLETPHYDYDAFISYNESDSKWIVTQLSPRLETEYHLRLCIRQRDWLAGQDIVDNIVDSIEKSRKTVLIVSNAFAVSHWCHFEMTMAQTKLLEDDRDNLILVLLEEIADCNMTPRLQLQMQKKTYIEWTDNQIGQQLFWAKLRRALSRQSQSVTRTLPPRELFASTE